MKFRKPSGFIFALLFSVGAYATQAGQNFQIRLDATQIKTEKAQVRGSVFTKIKVEGVESQKQIGAPDLPMKSFLLQGTPESIQVTLAVKSQKVLPQLKPYPVQAQDCRCITDVKKKFEYKTASYSQPLPAYNLEYLGSFRGTPITRLDVSLGEYHQQTNQVVLKTDVEVSVNAGTYTLSRGEYRDFLILVPKQFESGLADFVTWKKGQGYNVIVESLTTPGQTTQSVGALIKNHYTNNGVDFVMIVGDDAQIPMGKVATSGSSSTPSDLYYYTMDGAKDTVPDMFFSRVSTASAQQLKDQLAKSIEFEQKSYEDVAGMKRIVGIASNEGYAPSDDEYVKAIEKSFEETLGVTSAHFFQDDDANSKPEVLNKTLNEGAFWLTYLGHGSGSSWPSMAKEYSTSNIKELNNKGAVKPIIIDVACMNGRIGQSYLGSSFLKTGQSGGKNPFGAAAYYGGTVNISWHPPAVMAQGIAFEHLDKKFKHLGEALLAGQLYLAGKWSNQSDVVDNFEWYHLQGDPSLNIQF